MATRTPKNTTTQSNDFFGQVNGQLSFFERPKWSYQAADPMDRARDSIVAGIEKQLDILAGKDNIKGRPWYNETNNGMFIQWRLVNRVMKLKDNADSVKVNSVQEATRVYKLSMEAVKSGQFDTIIKSHLATIPKRAARGSSSKML